MTATWRLRSTGCAPKASRRAAKKGLARRRRGPGRRRVEGDKSGAVVEVNSETDFVARNAEFQEMVAEIAETALRAIRTPTVEALAERRDEVGRERASTSTSRIRSATIGENMTLRRVEARLSVSRRAWWRAMSTTPSVAGQMGKIGVLAAFESDGDKAEKLEGVGQAGLHAHRRDQPGLARRRRSRPGAGRAREVRC